MFSRYINTILIILGISIGFYAGQKSPADMMLLILAIIMLIIAVYRISKTVPSNTNREEDEDRHES
ncbi:MAG TPA: hypothetical protein VFF15_07500 [Flavobacteriaceae bacterium]|nr:hypothetical protein [Flavobacteriaceae bacterium]